VRRHGKWIPCEALRPYVASFDLRDDRLGTSRIFNPLPARSDCFLQFHFKQPYLVVNSSTGETHSSPSCIVVGPHTRRAEDLVWTGDLKAFTIRFSPVGFQSLFGIPAEVIRNLATSAELVLGPKILSLRSRLAEAHDDQMHTIAEDFLLTLLACQSARGGAAAVLRLTAAIRSSEKRSTLDQVALQHNLSLRQIERLFKEFVGVSPKVYEGLHRAKRAMALRRAHPEFEWSSIAPASGYFDQAHMIREFRNQNGSTPARFALAGQEAEQFRSRSFRSSSASGMSALYNSSAAHLDTVR
jgi:AraC-like DNA-binding protein